ncbi:MAG TPA: DUF1829 domain-containing protein [Pirellulales bacterium]|nr:DUF1829 domain-containing protein [Pirellulales bacterium]
MIEDVKQLLDAHWKWLRDKTQLRQLTNQWVEITTPYLDRHNDMLQIYAKRINGGFQLTDDGYTINDLIHSGCYLDSPKRKQLLKTTLAGFGVEDNGGRLEVHATEENFPLRKHSLIQAMLAVNDLFFLAVPVVSSLFYEDVQSWLDEHEVRYTPHVKFTGKSGYDHLFEFVIPKSRKQPERILQTINRPNRDNAEAFAFKWIDTKDVRSAESKAYAILNDQEHSISSGVFEALYNYDIHPVAWSLRDQVEAELAA